MDTADQHFEFHRLARSAQGYRWWKPLLTALLGIAFYVVILAVVTITGVIIAALSPTGIEPYTDALTALDLSNPVVFAFTMVSLILMIPALALATLIMGPRPIGLLSSVTGRIRWRWLLTCSGAAAAIFVASIGISMAVDAVLPGGEVVPSIQQDTSTLVLLLALTLLAVPFQAAAEEYVFRGFLMQAIGGWLRHPAFAILLPVPFFVVGHAYGLLGRIDIALFAVFAGWITWRTGGLEAAIAVHAVNNMTIFLLGAVGLADVNATDSSVTGVIVSVVTMAVTAVVIVRLADRRGIGRTRVVVPQPSVQYGVPPAYALAAAGHLPLPHPSEGQGQANPWGRGVQQGWPGAYDPRQYEGSRHSQAPRTAPVQPLPVPPPPAPTLAPPLEDPSGRTATAQGRPDPYPAGTGHPPGPAHPSGTPHPSGVPHPPGPGHPAPRTGDELPADDDGSSA